VGHQLVYATSERWAEPLDQAFERTLREDLAAHLAASKISVQSHGGRPSYDLTVDVLRFERSGPDHVELWAHWVLRAGKDVIDTGETRIRGATSGSDSNAMVDALSETIARMAGEIAGRVQHADAVATAR